MKKLLIYIFAFLSTPVFGQVAQCYCSKEPSMNESTVGCDTIVFKNNSKIYWQYNCDCIWLTLENYNKKRFIIDKVPIDLYPYTYRLGYHLIKEFNKTILFRSGCAANGPCNYPLVDKNNGKVIKIFNQLICIDTEADYENPCKYNYDFVVYLSENTDEIVVYFIESGRKVKKKFSEKINAVIPEHQFISMIYVKNILTIVYLDNKKKKKRIVINLK